MEKYALLILLLALPLTQALSILEPTTDITTNTLPHETTIQWSGLGPYNITVETTNQTLLNLTNTTQNTTTLNLQNNTYTITLTNNQTSTTQQFDIIHQQLTELTITTPRTEYKTQETVNLFVTTNNPTSATLRIRRGSQILETYQLSITETLSLIYIPEQEGTYIAELTTEETTAQTSFSVTAPEPLTIDFSHPSTITQNQRAEFVATASGGEEPYTYQWAFGDDTTATGRTHNHFFFESGPNNATLIVTDNEGSQQTTTKQFIVEEELYELEITILNQNNQPQEEITLRLTNTQQETQTQLTGTSGTTTFDNLHADNYTLLIQNDTETLQNNTIEITEDTNRLYTIQTPEETVEEQTQEEIEETPQEETTQLTEESQTTEEQIEEPTVQTTNTEEQLREASEQAELNRKIDDAISSIRDKKFSLRLDSTKDEAITHLELYDLYDNAIQEIQEATTTEHITQAQQQIPEEITITNEQKTIIYPEYNEEIIEYYLAETNQPEELHRDIKYSIKEQLKNASIEKRTYTATIQYTDKTETHTFVTKTITGGDSYIEVIPQTFAREKQHLKIHTNHEELHSSQQHLIEFSQNTYTYSTNKEANTEEIYTIIIPDTIESPALITGLLSIDIGESNGTRTLIYLIILMIAGGGMVVGKKLNTTPNTFEDFCSLTNQALEMASQGQEEVIVELTPQISELHTTLPKKEQEETQELIEHLNVITHTYHFNQAIQHLYAQAHTNNINALSALYEDAHHAYNQLPKDKQEEHKNTLEQVEQYLSQTITQ